MQKLSREIIKFFQKQGFVLISTIDKKGSINVSAKGIVGIEEEKIFLLDLYLGRTSKNLKNNTNVSVTAVDEHEFTGYTLKGTAKVIEKEKIEDHIVKSWQDRIVKRISNRLIKNIQGSKVSLGHHPEATLPEPKYLIEIDIKEVVDLAPGTVK